MENAVTGLTRLNVFQILWELSLFLTSAILTAMLRATAARFGCVSRACLSAHAWSWVSGRLGLSARRAARMAARAVNGECPGHRDRAAC
jgi:hypothetical protein